MRISKPTCDGKRHQPPPQRIRIGCYDYDVVKRDAQWATESRSVGDTNNGELSIGYAPQAPQQEINTIIHEVMHAICYVGMASEAIADAGDSDRAEERLVTIMANQWHQVIRDNPELIAYITQ